MRSAIFVPIVRTIRALSAGRSVAAPRRAAALLLALALAMALPAALAAPLLAAEAAPYRLTILHTNDIHAHMAEFDRLGQTCTAEEAAKGGCLGGYPRIAAAVEAERRKGGNILLLDAGDQFQGTLFYTLLKGAPCREAMNALRYTAMTLGNHEFDDGPRGLEDTFLQGLTVPVLAANIDASREPGLAARIKPWTTVVLGGRTVGLVGMANEDTATLSSPGPDVAFARAEEPLRKAAAELRAKGATMVVAITHLGYDRDKELAAAVDGVDVIVGGHSHTLLSNTDPAASGPYPTVVRSPSGKPVLVVQAGAWGKYLGELFVDFDAKGVPVAWSGGPVLLDASRPADKAMQAKVDGWREALAPSMGQVVGRMTEALNAVEPSCRHGECALGDLVADAVRRSAKPQGAQAAIINGGALRAGLRAGPVTLGDVLTVYPFPDTVATFQLKGQDILEVLEYGVTLADTPDASGTGRFLQVSGLRYAFDARRPAGSRIVSADILNPDGGYAPVQPEQTYTLASNGFLLKGGDGYALIKERARRVYAFGKPILDALTDYLSSQSPVTPRLEGRITRMGESLPR